MAADAGFPRRRLLAGAAGLVAGCVAPTADRVGRASRTAGASARDRRRARETARRARPGVVVLQPADATDSGTAWFLDDGRLLTAAHVVDELGEGLRATTVDGDVGDVAIEGRWPAPDLAALSTDIEPPATLEFGEASALHVGQPVVQIGHTRVAYWTVALGRFRRLRETRDRTLVLTDVATLPGNSGSPLLTLAGDVVGMTVGTLPRTGRPPSEHPRPGPITVYEAYPRRSIRYGAHLAPSTIDRYLARADRGSG